MWSGRVGGGREPVMREKSVLCNFARRVVEEFWKLVHRNVALAKFVFVLSLPPSTWPRLGKTREDDPSSHHPWTSAGIGGNEINFYFEKFPSFHRGQLETWLGRHGLNRMITRNRIRWTFFGANRFHRFYRVLENEEGW